MMRPMHPECWLCGSPNLLFSGVCTGCGHHLWRDRALDVLFVAVSIVLLLLLLEGGERPVPIP